MRWALLCSAYEDEDLQDIRASMERLLQEEAEEAVMAAGDLNGNPAGDAEQELFSRQPPEMHPNNQMAVDDEEEDDDDDEEGDDDDEEEADEEDEECSNGSPGDEEAGELLSNGMGEERCRNNKQLNEEWHSGRRLHFKTHEAASSHFSEDKHLWMD